jgi:hypothetical protein
MGFWTFLGLILLIFALGYNGVFHQIQSDDKVKKTGAYLVIGGLAVIILARFSQGFLGGLLLLAAVGGAYWLHQQSLNKTDDDLIADSSTKEDPPEL